MRRILLGLVVFTAVVAGGLASASILLRPSTVGPAVAPGPDSHPEAVIQVYGADVWGIRGHFAIHTWIAVKPQRAEQYTVYQVIGWRLRRGQPVLSKAKGRPDVPWFGSAPMLLHELRGEGAEPLVQRVVKAAESYPYPRAYTMYPGPNSNSFTQWVALSVPELGLDLPAKAIGKNWMTENFEAGVDPLGRQAG